MRKIAFAILAAFLAAWSSTVWAGGPDLELKKRIVQSGASCDMSDVDYAINLGNGKSFQWCGWLGQNPRRALIVKASNLVVGHVADLYAKADADRYKEFNRRNVKMIAGPQEYHIQGYQVFAYLYTFDYTGPAFAGDCAAESCSRGSLILVVPVRYRDQEYWWVMMKSLSGQSSEVSGVGVAAEMAAIADLKAILG